MNWSIRRRFHVSLVLALFIFHFCILKKKKIVILPFPLPFLFVSSFVCVCVFVCVFLFIIFTYSRYVCFNYILIIRLPLAPKLFNFYIFISGIFNIYLHLSSDIINDCTYLCQFDYVTFYNAIKNVEK